MWEEFLADLEHYPGPAHTWLTIKVGSIFPVLVASSQPVLHNGCTSTICQGKSNAFLKVYSAVDILTFAEPKKRHSSSEGSPLTINCRRSLLATVPTIGTWSWFTTTENQPRRHIAFPPSLKRWAHEQNRAAKSKKHVSIPFVLLSAFRTANPPSCGITFAHWVKLTWNVVVKFPTWMLMNSTSHSFMALLTPRSPSSIWS